jgi:diguanylate cyclase (GGDEF)-like protein
MPENTRNNESDVVIRALYEIASAYDLGFEEQVQRLLELGLQRFDLDIGILSRVEGQTYRVLHHLSPPNIVLENGAEFPLGETYCSVTLQSNGPVGVEKAQSSIYAEHPAYRRFRLEAYLGVPIRVRNQVYGTLNFSSPTAKSRRFSAIDIDTLKLMAAWIGSELSRRQTEAELRQAKERLEEQSTEDPLTHLHNRRGVEEKLARLAERSAFRQTSLMGLLIDIDGLKEANDSLGRSVGDKVLAAIASAIKNAVRPNDVCGRVGGDEFMVLLPDCQAEDPVTIGERIRSAAASLQIRTADGDFMPSVSVGVFPVPRHVERVAHVLQAGTISLKRAKEAGKNTVSA